MYEITKNDIKFCQKRNIDIEKYIKKHNHTLIKRPYKLKGYKAFKARINDKYRIIYQINGIIQILKIENRDKCYK